MWFKKLADKIHGKERKITVQEEHDVNKITLFFFGVYLIIYLFFVGEGVIPPGAGLDKSDWLSFLGSYLSFFGALFVCYISVSQNKVFMKRSEVQKKEDRFNQIQPILSVDVITKNKSRKGCKDDLKKDEALVLKEFIFTIKNLGAFPALHVCVFNEYLLPALAPGETLKFICGYNIKTNVHISPNDITLQLPAGATGALPPQIMPIEYYDVDGCSMIQRFQRGQYQNKELYVLLKKEKL